MSMKAVLRLSVAIACMMLLSGCSSFHREWRKAGREATPPPGIEGRWDGRWLSDANGHHGRLRAVITRTAPGKYRAHYRAKFLRIMSYSYAAELTARETSGVYSFDGQADLGRLAGGVYSYAGTASTTNFHSSYKSKYDQGNYDMRRP